MSSIIAVLQFALDIQLMQSLRQVGFKFSYFQLILLQNAWHCFTSSRVDVVGADMPNMWYMYFCVVFKETIEVTF